MINTKLTHKLQQILFLLNFTQASPRSLLTQEPTQSITEFRILIAQQECDQNIRSALKECAKACSKAYEKYLRFQASRAAPVLNNLSDLTDREPKWVVPSGEPTTKSESSSPTIVRGRSNSQASSVGTVVQSLEPQSNSPRDQLRNPGTPTASLDLAWSPRESTGPSNFVGTRYPWGIPAFVGSSPGSSSSYSTGSQVVCSNLSSPSANS